MPETKKIKVAIVGLGKIGMTLDQNLAPQDFVYSHARAFCLHERFELIAGVDANAQRRSEFQASFHTPAFAHLSESLLVQHPDLVVISVPTEMHANAVRSVTEICKPSAILCEKPLSYSLQDAEEIVALCENAGIALYVNYMRRADEAVNEIKKRLETGEISTPIKGVAWYSKGLFNNGSHLYDLLRHWLGSMKSFKLIGVGASWEQDPQPDFVVRFEQGDVYFVAADEKNYSHYTIELIASNGRLRYDFGGNQVSWQTKISSDILPDYSVLDERTQTIANSMSSIQWHISDQIALSMSGKSASICTGTEALATIKDLTQICEQT